MKTQNEFRKIFLDLIGDEVKDLSRAELEAMTAAELVSPFVLELPREILDQASQTVEAFFALRSHPETRAERSAEAANLGISSPGNYGICMSYDFHLDENNRLKLIEVNTNAAFQGLSWYLYQAAGLQWPVAGYTPDELRKSIEEEIKLASPSSPGKTWVVMDETPNEQKLRLEFQIFKAWFQKWGHKAAIKDIHEISSDDKFVYNRYTDFFFAENRSKNLREFFNSREICFSPQPMEYLSLADKERLVEWSLNAKSELDRISTEKSTALKSALLSCKLLTVENADELWTNRKSYFFKPLRAYGGKQSYRGSSISRRHFEELIGQEILAQEYVPAPERSFASPEGDLLFKYDLRFYAYKGRLQGAVARLYQGQLTNLRSAYGGFTPIRFV